MGEPWWAGGWTESTGVTMAGWNGGYTSELCSRRALLCPPALPFISCVTLDRLLNLSGPRLPTYHMEMITLPSRIILHDRNTGGSEEERRS